MSELSVHTIGDGFPKESLRQAAALNEVLLSPYFYLGSQCIAFDLKNRATKAVIMSCIKNIRSKIFVLLDVCVFVHLLI